MKIVIDIPEHIYEHAKEQSEDSNDEWDAMRAIANGTPLPKGHGRLIDADRLECDYFNRTSDTYAFDCIDSAQTIIGADRAESGDRE